MKLGQGVMTTIIVQIQGIQNVSENSSNTQICYMYQEVENRLSKHDEEIKNKTVSIFTEMYLLHH